MLIYIFLSFTLHSMEDQEKLFLPRDIPLNKLALLSAHDSHCSSAYGWRYCQQFGTLREQWNAGARWAKINLMWRTSMSWFQQIQMERSGKVPTNRQAPFIAAGHEPDAGNNCLTASLIVKKGEVQHAASYFQELADLLKENDQDVFILSLEDYLQSNRSAKNGALQFTDQQVRAKLHQELNSTGLAAHAFVLDESYYPKVDMRTNKWVFPAPDWPTIDQMCKKQKRLIIMDDEVRNAHNSTTLSFIYNIFPGYSSSWGSTVNNPNYHDGDAFPFQFSLPVDYWLTPWFKVLMFFGLKSWLKKLGVNTKIVNLAPHDYQAIHTEPSVSDRIKRLEQVYQSFYNDDYKVQVVDRDFVTVGTLLATINAINQERADSFYNNKKLMKKKQKKR